MLPPDLESLLLLESPFARMPYEDLRRRLRTHQRIVEREFGAVNTLVGGINATTSKDDAVHKIDAVIERVKAIKGKVSRISKTMYFTPNRSCSLSPFPFS